MKIAFVVHTDVYAPRVAEILQQAGIDYFTRWHQVEGKGHKTEPHLGTRSFPELNSVLMIAFEEDEKLETLVAKIGKANAEIVRIDDRIRLFQVPLERIV
ncbi:MAG: PG0541 family transporter-associated protein [Bacteroidota bacterium]